MEWLIVGFLEAISPENVVVAFVGCFLGTLVGVLPGLGPTAAVALLFPFTAILSPVATLIGLGAIYYGAMYGDSISATILNIPGTTAAVPTALEAHPLAKQGRAGSALVICALSSFWGGTMAIIFLAFFAPVIANIALKFGPFEYFALMLFSLACASGLSSSSVLKGLGAAFLGLTISFIGVDFATGAYRFSYGLNILLRGLNVVPIAVGLFGVAEVLSGISKDSKAVVGEKVQSLRPSKKELTLSLKAMFRGSLIGSGLGVLPGIGPSVASFISYAVTKRVAVQKHLFGKGAVEGIAGSEAANNAAAVTGFVPLLALGVPTTPVLAIVLAALIIQGVTPGPLMFTVYKEMTATVIASFFIGNIILIILNIPLVGMWVKITALPYRWLAPVVLFLCVMGSYAVRNSLFDVWMLLFFGVLGYLAKGKGLPIAPFVLGVILGPLMETYFRQAATLGFSVALQRPFALFAMFGAMLVVIAFSRLTIEKETA